MTASDASTGWESGDSTATDRPPVPPFWWSETGGLIGPVIPITGLPADAVRLIPVDPAEADIVGSRVVSLMRQGNDLNDRVTRERDQLRAEVESARETLAVCTDQTAEIDRLTTQRDAALGLHASAKNYTGCRACYRDWPCPTARALGVTDV